MTDGQLVDAARALQSAIDKIKACSAGIATAEEMRRLIWSAREVESGLLWLKSVRPNATQ